jgi:hypothetical protein
LFDYYTEGRPFLQAAIFIYSLPVNAIGGASVPHDHFRILEYKSISGIAGDNFLHVPDQIGKGIEGYAGAAIIAVSKCIFTHFLGI